MKYLIAIVLTALPGFAFAACSGHSQAASCADGYVWDGQAGACVVQSNV